MSCLAKADQVDSCGSTDDAALKVGALIDGTVEVAARCGASKPDLLDSAKATVIISNETEALCKASCHNPVCLLLELHFVEYPQGNPYSNRKRNGEPHQ
jgi:hypothetical protein